jgi:hypothetical protein
MHVNLLSVAEAAYIAGIVDGEGSIMLSPSAGRYRFPVLAIANNDRQLLEWIDAIVGGGRIAVKPARKPTHSESYMWEIKNRRCIAICEQLRPYLRVARKVARVAIIVDRYTICTPANGHYTPAQRAAKEAMETAFFEA